MYSLRLKLTTFLIVFVLLVCSIQAFRINDVETGLHDKNAANEQTLTAAQLHALEQMLSRRSLYDPAYSDSWSNYFEKKRNLFDPAYSDWANSFKRSEE